MNDFFSDVKLAQKGSTEAFARLYESVYKDMYHIALYSLRNSHDAADTVSDTVLDAFCSIKKLREPSLFRRWIMKILSAKIKQKQHEYYAAAEELEDAFHKKTYFHSYAVLPFPLKVLFIASAQPAFCSAASSSGRNSFSAFQQRRISSRPLQ